MRFNFNTKWLTVIAERLQRFFSTAPRVLVRYFLNGLIIIIPLAVTLWLLAWIFNIVDGLLSPFVVLAFGHRVPGLGFVLIITLISVIGYLGIRTGRRRAFNLFETQVMRIPVIGGIYGSMRQILESFTTSTGNFLEVVFMEFPRKGIYTVGLVTAELTDKNGNKVYNVFIPTAPNPTSGFLQIVPESDVVRTSMSINDALKLIISAGKVTGREVADVISTVPEPPGKEEQLEGDGLTDD